MSQAQDQKIPVMEIFGPTFQGEGALCGHQTHFIRFGGCDYRCTKCDSMHAVDGDQIRANATYMTQPEVFKAIFDHMQPTACGLITFSGGNPALWDLSEVAKALNDVNVTIALETQGTYWKDWIQRCDIITVSPKGPGMGEKFDEEQFTEYLTNLRGHRGLSIKIVIFSAIDIEFALTIRDMMDSLDSKHVPIFLSLGNSMPPGQADPKMSLGDFRNDLLESMVVLADEILQDPRCTKFIFLPQMHVLLWGNRQGV